MTNRARFTLPDLLWALVLSAFALLPFTAVEERNDDPVQGAQRTLIEDEDAEERLVATLTPEEVEVEATAEHDVAKPIRRYLAAIRVRDYRV